MRIIVVGLGKVSGAWLKAILAFEHYTLVALVEIDTENAHRRMKEFHITDVPLFSDLSDAITNIQADGLVDLTPPAFRLHNAQLAFNAGLHVIAEKPLSENIEMAESLVNFVSGKDLIYMIAQNYRYGHVVQTAKHMLDSGSLGQIGAITVNFFRGIDLPGFHSKLSDVLLQDMSIHHFDLMRFFLEREPISLFARSWNVPYSWHKGNASVSASLEFEGNIIVTYSASWASTGYETTWNGNWRFDCEKGTLQILDDEIHVQMMDGFHNDILRAAKKEVIPAFGNERGDRSYILQEFYEAVTRGHVPATRAEDNIHSFRMVMKAIESSRAKLPVNCI